VVKNPPVLQAVWGRFPEEGNGNPLQYSCLENAIATVHGVTKSQTQLNAGEGVEKRELSYTVGGNAN